ncbi:Putative zinc-finger [Moorella glycerini]|uniref:Anti-sigma-W factor RsiW n=1 Tax=Neomoorella stamsii TaxID=1266720 RepID=A0A9X7J0Q1_9FIRM|nr:MULTISPECIES: zf-HC2 domain-containing protein [Moorella]PRR69981.1 hypothetical protein MOST_28580 [Moorella stamsii]CEP68468.1 Putative zinc-finger [Moorella glycerini]
MQCREAREFFSPCLDGELSPAEKAVLRQHLDKCPACCAELKRWQEISRALRGLKAQVAVPPGFLAAANARLAARQRVRTWQGIRRWVAAAAAVAVLAAGSISYAARGLWQHLPAPVARVQQGGGQQLAVDNPHPDVEQPGTNLPPDSGYSQPVKPDGQQPDSGNAPGKNQLPVTAPGNGGGQPVTPDSDKPGQQPTRLADSEPYTARTFLSAERQATSTMIKITVQDDITGTKAKALSLASSSGATVQVIADQDNGQVKRVIYKFTVAESQAAALLAGLSQLGQVIAKNTSTQDLTQQFSATLEQYQAKVAQVNAAADPEERAKLSKEAKALEQQLSTWEEETKQYTIILWLETK